MRANRTVRWLLLSFVAALAGCGAHDKKDTGVLVVPYELGNHRACGDLGITTVRAELDDGQYRTVPDIERELSGDELGEVDVQAYDKDAIGIGQPITFTFDAPGAGGAVKLSLNCDAGGCKGTGAAD